MCMQTMDYIQNKIQGIREHVAKGVSRAGTRVSVVTDQSSVHRFGSLVQLHGFFLIQDARTGEVIQKQICDMVYEAGSVNLQDLYPVMLQLEWSGCHASREDWLLLDQHLLSEIEREQQTSSPKKIPLGIH
ncbi:hypothetical protein ACFYKX_11270 [Cytobacillus sp. FJAT-54145]|uniref:Uncharacterized protein n=1 Tax=Cytobacillus spartinae TaxID=3299023 RepID=A0ABW6KE60_9BACI